MNKTTSKAVLIGLILFCCVFGALHLMMDKLTSLQTRQYCTIIIVSGCIFGFLYRLLLKNIAGKKTITSKKNINTRDRLMRGVSGCILLCIAMFTAWNPLLLFFAGFCFFEALFSRCGLYGALGKSSCPL